jgi:hypothetical protein
MAVSSSLYAVASLDFLEGPARGRIAWTSE